MCTRSKPTCDTCPLKKSCHSFQSELTKVIPVSKPKKSLPVRQTTFLLLQKDDFILLQKRPPTGIWGSLWSFPEIAGLPDQAAIELFCKQQLRIESKHLKNLQAFRHTFSHFHLDVLPVLAQVKKASLKIMDSENQIWYNLNARQILGLPAPVKTLLEKIR